MHKSDTIVLYLLAIAICTVPTHPIHADSLDDALALEGITRDDLGFQQRGYWSRYPADIPYKMRHFDSLMAEPLAIPTFVRTSANAFRTYLDPEGLSEVGDMGATSLFSAVYALGIERRFGAFRSYSANLTAPDEPDLVEALLAIHEAGGRSTAFVTFGNVSPYPDYRSELEALVADIPEEARAPLARLIINALDAHAWVELGFRRVDPDDRLRIQQRYDLSVELTDGLEYMPEIDDAMADLDEASLWYGGLKAVAALDLARIELENLGETPAFAVDWPTPLGWVRIRGGGPDVVDADECFLIVDLGGDDEYFGAAAASAPGLPVSLLLDMGGDDRYVADERPAQGAGMGGVGVLVDVAGDDTYEATQCAQGWGQLGLGVLADFDGQDTYSSAYASQGAAIFGVGVLVDNFGSDRYQVYSDGQGFGGSGGVGTLADRVGDDTYEAVVDPAITGRPSYHSELEVTVSNAQGVGLGRRGDGGDGHSWAGGLGQLVDLEGDDTYIAGNWSMGTGYWFGTGLLYDGSGDDSYNGVVWSQGTGAHFCIGALIDEGGNDSHISEGGRLSLAFGHDFTVALLLNVGGDDHYQSGPEGIGYSINRSFAFAIDVGGDDTYVLEEEAAPGTARYDDRFANYDGVSTYLADADSLGLFLDVGGTDSYDTARGADNTNWLDPEDSPNRLVRNRSIGADVAEGEVVLNPATGNR